MAEARAASPAPEVEVRGLTKSFNHRPALRGIDLDIGPGESVVIFGPNGAGKTTLLKILATIMNPSSGTVLVDGLDCKKNAEEVRRRIGIVSHHTYLYNSLTAYENLEFYARMYDVPRPRERAYEVAAMVAMTARLHDRVGTLSRGMQQRLSIARSLLHKPSLMLMDEPETGLDQQAISMLWAILHEEGEAKRTVILVTHSLERGLELGDRLVILNRGRVVFQKPRQDLDLNSLRQAYQQSTGAAR
ncbi:MAG: heme ABC exporter ATP-binding protein CcmA [Dehalococcoidales bacterium]